MGVNDVLTGISTPLQEWLNRFDQFLENRRSYWRRRKVEKLLRHAAFKEGHLTDENNTAHDDELSFTSSQIISVYQRARPKHRFDCRPAPLADYLDGTIRWREAMSALLWRVALLATFGLL